MLRQVFTRTSSAVSVAFRRNFGLTVPASQTATNLDPIQKLYVDQIQMYKKQKDASGGKLVGATPELEQELQDRLDNLARAYNLSPEQAQTVPEFAYNDPDIDISVDFPSTLQATEAEEAEQAEVEVDDEITFIHDMFKDIPKPPFMKNMS